MRILAVSYMLPPMLFPQAIQIGRLLENLPDPVGAVSGLAEGEAGPYAFRVQVPHRLALPPKLYRIARLAVPFYARSPDEYRGWVDRAEAALLPQLDSFAPDLLVSFGEPMSDHLLGLRLKRRLGLPWLAHFSDPWADNPFRAREVCANLINRPLERRVMKAADRVVFTSAETRNLVMAKYPAAWRDKVEILPHSYDPTLYPPRSASPGAIVVRYLGNFYGHRSPAPLYRALALLSRRNPEVLEGVTFELVGSMPGRMKLIPAAFSLPDGLIRMAGSVPYAASCALMAKTDLLLVIDGPADLSVFLPSKLIDYVGSGAPIFGIVPPGTSANLLACLGGKSADPRQPEAVAEGLAQALTEIRRRRRANELSPWGEPAVRAEFTVDRVVARFRQILERTVAG